MALPRFITENAEEFGEGALLALLTAGSVAPQDDTLESKALQVLGAAGMGVGMGIGARHIGARLGKRWHRGELQNPSIAAFARSAGSESILEGLDAQGKVMKEGIEKSLRNNTAKELINKAANNPEAFRQEYGLDPRTFIAAAERVAPLQNVSAVASTLQSMPAHLRDQKLSELWEAMPPHVRNSVSDDAAVAGAAQQEMNRRMQAAAADVMARQARDLLDADDLIAKTAGGQFDRRIRELADMLEETSPEGFDIGGELKEHLPLAGLLEGHKITPELLRSWLKPAEPVTGEHLGRAVGRFAGDEIGAILGQIGGRELAQLLGLAKQPEQDAPPPLSGVGAGMGT